MLLQLKNNNKLPIIISSLSGLLFGIDTGNIAGSLAFIKKEFSTSIMQDEIVVSITILMAFLSSFLLGRLIDKIGQRNSLIYCSIMFAIGALLGTYSRSLAEVIIARGILGVAIGVSSFVTPSYISEITPARDRGKLVLINSITITLGECIAFLAGYFLCSNGVENWRSMFLLGFLPATVLFAGMVFMPHSPRWLFLQDKPDQAFEILKRYDPINAQSILNKVKSSLTNYSNSSLFELLKSKKFKTPLFIGITLGVLQQFFGINAMMYYGPSIFQKAGFVKHGDQMLLTFVLGLTNTLITLMLGIYIDRVGRRKFLMIGSLLACFSLLCVSTAFHSNYHFKGLIIIICMILYICGYCMSVGSLFWLVISEIFPLQIKGFGMGLATSIQWLANFLNVAFFLSAIEKFHPSFVFIIYSCLCFLTYLFSKYFVPETKNLSLEDISCEATELI